ncbi:MAG: Cna B-type domain-containing protein [Clostridia bacterium]|nr:Cna B-type domain-containing protein [Clostridia bacterium]
MKTCMTHLLILTLCLLLCVNAWPGSAHAFEMVDLAHPVTLTLFANDEEIPLPGVGFELYRVADMNDYAQFELCAAYQEFSGDINRLEFAADWILAAEEMLAMSGGQEPAATATSGDDGLAVFTDLTPGLYLVTGKPVTIDPWIYTFTPFLVSVPNRDWEDEWVYDVFSDVKLEKTPAWIDVEVVKVWDDEGYEYKRPGYIYADLYCDGEKIDSAKLNAANSWYHVFENLPAAHEYTVVERKVPHGYKESYEVVNGALVIRNERDANATPIPDIPATGQLWWPVPILAGLGVLLVIIGWYISRKWSQEHEE